MKQPKICISPLDWGLGHATRCIPLILALQKLGYDIYIASERHHEVILKQAIPEAHFLTLRGYRVRYSKNRNLFFVSMFLQAPKILFSMVYEYWWLSKKAKQHHFDLIISDNRLGFFHRTIKSVFITHQLNLQTPFRWTTRLFQLLQYAVLKNYSACWVPDMEGANSLAGILSNPEKKPNIPLWYMGCLARLHHTNQNGSQLLVSAHPIHFIGIVSGPEPQRTLLENILWNEGVTLHIPFVMVAGKPQETNYNKVADKGKLYHHLPGDKLAAQIQRAEYVICRGGYTSLMELIPFQKKLILVPTPGQTEQEYLAKRWQEKNWAIFFNQADFDLSTALAKAAAFNFITPPFLEMQEEDLKMNLKKLSL